MAVKVEDTGRTYREQNTATSTPVANPWAQQYQYYDPAGIHHRMLTLYVLMNEARINLKRRSNRFVMRCPACGCDPNAVYSAVANLTAPYSFQPNQSIRKESDGGFERTCPLCHGTGFVEVVPADLDIVKPKNKKAADASSNPEK